MNKWYEMIVKAIEITKQYNDDEVKLLSGLFTYLNSLDIDDEWFGTGVSAKWLWKLLNPLTRTWNSQPFREWWESVSNLARLKDNKDYEKKEQLVIKNISHKPSFAWGGNSQEYKEINDISKEYFAKDFFMKDWLFDLEKVENKLAVIIWYLQPNNREKLKDLIKDFLNKEVKDFKTFNSLNYTKQTISILLQTDK